MTLRRIDYNQVQHQTYADGRRMPPETLARWMARFAAHLPAARPLTIIDLGSGVGRLTPALADTFGGPVFGVEPAAAMRAIAEASATHPAVQYLEGEAAGIPLPDQSADAVLMFLSLHHVPDRIAAAREIARVLKPGGRVLIRTALSDRMGEIWWHQFFDRARDIEMAMFPTLGQVTADFASAGLRLLTLERVAEAYGGSEAEAAEKLKLRATSVFEHMSEAEIARGFARLDAWLATADTRTEARPIEGDLLVLG
jgi:ubiquinone/menaquinone biosynthesis C-methylase UbiE